MKVPDREPDHIEFLPSANCYKNFWFEEMLSEVTDTNLVCTIIFIDNKIKYIIDNKLRNFTEEYTEKYTNAYKKWLISKALKEKLSE